MTWSWRGRPCLVTGGAGFGGSHLVLALSDLGADVYPLDRLGPNASALLCESGSRYRNWIQADVRDIEALQLAIERYQIDTIFHLAAQPLVRTSNILPAETISVNVRGTWEVLEAMRTTKAASRLIFASSGAHYGASSTDAPLAEDQVPFRSTNIYGPSKTAAEVLVQAYVNVFGLNAAICRFMNTYGPGDTNFSRLVPRAIWNLLTEAPYDFGDCDDGSTRLDFLHIVDMTRAYISVAEHVEVARGEAFNFGTGRLHSVSDVARMISRAFDGREREPLFRGSPRQIAAAKCLDASKAQRMLAWNAEIGFEDGVRSTLSWYRCFYAGRLDREPSGPAPRSC